MVGAIAIVGFQIVAQSTSQSELNKVEIVVTAIRVVGTGSNNLELEIGIEVDNPTTLDISYDDFSIILSYSGTSFGTADIKSEDLTGGSNQLMVDTSLSITDAGSFQTFLEDFFANEEVTVAVEGAITLHSTVYVLEVTTENSLAKDVAITGLGGLSDVKVGQVELVNASGSLAYLNLAGSFEKASPVSLTVEDLDVAIMLDNQELGSFTVDELALGSDTTSFEGLVILNPSNASLLAHLTSNYLSGNDISLQLDGNFSAILPGLQGAETAGFSVTHTLTGSGELSVVINGIELLETSDTTARFLTNLTLTNPTQVSGFVEELGLELLSPDMSVIGSIMVEDVPVNLENTTHVLYTILTPTNNTVLKETFIPFLNGENISFYVRGSSEGSLSELLKDWSTAVTLESSGTFDIDVQELKFINATEDGMFADVSLVIVNPTTFEVTLEDLTVDVLDKTTSQAIGEIKFDSVRLVPGSNSLTKTVEFTPTNTSLIAEVVGKYLKGESMTLEVTPQETPNNWLSSLVSGFSTDVVVQASGAFDIEVTSVGFVNSSDTSLFLTVELELTNPTNMTVEMENLTFKLKNKQDSSVLGELTIPHIRLEPGLNHLLTDVELTPSNTMVLASMINDYMSGDDLTLVVEGIDTQDNWLGSLLSSISTEVVLKGVEPVDIAIMSVELLNTTSNTLSLNVTVRINNPTPNAVSVTSLNFTIDYEGSFLGNVTLPAFTAQPGEQIYIIEVSFTPANNTALTELLEKYLSNEPINLTITGDPSGADILSQVLANYVAEIPLPSLDIDPQISGLNVVNSTETTLGFEANITLTNPSKMDIEVGSIDLDLYYHSQQVGTISLPAMTLVPGQNKIEATGYLGMYGNKTNLELFLSNYIGGQELTVGLDGNLQTDLNGIIPTTDIPIATEITFIGVTEDLIQAVMINDIALTLLPFSVDVDTTASILNPMSFAVNITYLQFDLFFDDADGASYSVSMFGPHYNYGSASDIYISTITDNRSAGVIELDAGESMLLNYSIVTDDIELAVRLDDEYNKKDQLYVDVLSGTMILQIGSFEVTVSFEFFNVRVPKS